MFLYDFDYTNALHLTGAFKKIFLHANFDILSKILVTYIYNQGNFKSLLLSVIYKQNSSSAIKLTVLPTLFINNTFL